MNFFLKKLNQLFNRVGKRKKQLTNTHFHYPLKPTHLKGRKVPLHLLTAVSKELDRLTSEGHIKRPKKDYLQER